MINLKKNSFMQEEIVYLGFFILANGLRMDLEKVKAIMEWPTLENVCDVKSFHGLDSFYRKFIRNFSVVCNAMTETMRGDKKDFKWTYVEDKSLEALNKVLSSYMFWICLISTRYFKLNVMQVVV